MNDEANIICVADRVGHSYGSRVALTDVSFALPQGTVIGLVGANGSGKSTLLRILAGIQRPTRGTIVAFGEDLSASESAGRGLGAAVDGMALWPSWTVRHNLHYIAGLCGSTDQQVHTVMELVDIVSNATTRLRKLSLGNRQRVLLAASILVGTRMILMDEPMNGLDPDTRQRTRELMLTLAARGRTIVVSSHDLHDVESICSQLVVLDQGRTTFVGPIGAFKSTSTMTLLRTDADDAARAHIVLTELGLHCRRDSSGALIVTLHDAAAATAALTEAGIRVLDTAERRATLEEKFHELR